MIEINKTSSYSASEQNSCLISYHKGGGNKSAFHFIDFRIVMMLNLGIVMLTPPVPVIWKHAEQLRMARTDGG
jgi:hypothetical protein